MRQSQKHYSANRVDFGGGKALSAAQTPPAAINPIGSIKKNRLLSNAARLATESSAAASYWFAAGLMK